MCQTHASLNGFESKKTEEPGLKHTSQTSEKGSSTANSELELMYLLARGSDGQMGWCIILECDVRFGSLICKAITQKERCARDVVQSGRHAQFRIDAGAPNWDSKFKVEF